MSRSRTVIRAILVLVIAFSVMAVTGGYLTAQESTELRLRDQIQLPEEQRTSIADSRRGMTVITTQRRQNADRAPGSIIALDSDGTLEYYNQTYHSYWDVDPVPNRTRTVTYVASRDAKNDCPNVECWENVIERVNLTTGEVTRLYERIVPKGGSARWHDVDQINRTHLLVADIADDQVFIVNIRTGIVEWTWEASSSFLPNSGGVYNEDWTHLNDVERLSDGRIMVSLRNQDQVVFIDPSAGIQRNWTLGRDDDYSILYEQHNPDYIPTEEGGPAVLVANSEKSSVVEYTRVSGEWREAWHWSDTRMQWPRDADRLPNGHTLVTDTHGGRIIEIGWNGTVRWQFEVIAPYEAERLSTGAESTNGPSASRANLVSNRPEINSSGNPVVGTLQQGVFVVSNSLPPIVINGLLWVLPPWMSVRELLAAAVGVLALGNLGLAEIYWRYAVVVRSPFTGSLRLPVTLSRRKK